MKQLFWPILILSLLRLSSVWAIDYGVSNTIIIHAYDVPNATDATGMADYLTVDLSLDGAASVPLTDTTPVELSDGLYSFSLSASEASHTCIAVIPQCSYPNIYCDKYVLYTRPVERGTNSALLASGYTAPANATVELIYDEVAGLNGGSIYSATDVWAATTRTLSSTDVTVVDINASSLSEIEGTWVGDGDVLVDEDTGGDDALSYEDDGSGIDNAIIRAYVTSEYDISRTSATVRAQTYTDSAGHWVSPMYLNDGVGYTLVFEKAGVYGPDIQEVTP